MDPLTMTLLGAGGSLFGNLFGGWMSGNESDKALEQFKQFMTKIANEYGADYTMPNYTPLDYNPESYSFTPMGEYDYYNLPTDLEAQLVEGSPKYRAMQDETLANLEKRANEGMTAQDLADFTRQRRQVEETAKGREGAILQNLAARGLGQSGIGAGYLADTQQDAMERLNQAALERSAANAQQRALAEMNKATLAGQLESRDIGMNTTNANIMNQFAQYNSAAKQAVEQMNTQLRNKQKLENYQGQQNTNFMNTQQRNQASLLNKQDLRSREKATNQYKKDMANMKFQTGQTLAQIPLQQGAANAASWRNIGNVIGNLPGQALNMYSGIQGINNTNDQMAFRKKLDNRLFGSMSGNDPYNVDYNDYGDKQGVYSDYYSRF